MIWLRYSQSFTLMTKNLKLVNGIIIRDKVSLRLVDIQAIYLKRNMLDFLLNCGTLLVGTAATAGTKVKIFHVGNVKDLQARLNELRDKTR